MAMSDVERAVVRLLQGVATRDTVIRRDAWRRLVDAGPGAVPHVLAKLDSAAWGARPKGPSFLYLGVLLSLLHTLDVPAFRAEIGRLRAARLHDRHRRVVDFMAKMSDAEPVLHLTDGTPVFVAEEIEDRERIAGYVARWGRTPGVELGDVSRIDVICWSGDMEYVGLYRICESAIVLTWPAGRAWSLVRWWRRIEAEHTFYHEVGHHVCGHLEGGRAPELEREADDFARWTMYAAHPLFFGTVKTLLLPFKPIVHLWMRLRRRRTKAAPQNPE